MAGKHSDKHVRKALEFAEAEGWIVTEAGPRAHAWGKMRCSYGHDECRMSIWSTPRNTQDHAKDIIRKVKRCPGPDPD